MVSNGGSELSRRAAALLRALEDLGQKTGLEARREYPVVGGRIDLVWVWRVPRDMQPVSDGELPVVGFEIESSWRTRKHLKGDFLNLFDLGASLGVIVLLGTGKAVEATQRFAQVMVKRPGPRIVVWTEADVARLLNDGPRVSSPAQQAATHALTDDGFRIPAGKYRPLSEWLRSQPVDRVRSSLAEVEAVIGMPLPHSARTHQPYWYGYKGSALARAIHDAKWRAREVDLTRGLVTFIRD